MLSRRVGGCHIREPAIAVAVGVRFKAPRRLCLMALARKMEMKFGVLRASPRQDETATSNST